MILRAKEVADIDSLMIWTDHDLELYEELINACRKCGVAPYLWFPVLADVQGTLIAETDLLLTYNGSRGYGKIGAWRQLGSSEESFRFYCPNREGAVDGVFRVYTGLLDRLDFAGVMLDRIRYPSVVNGFETIFSCFCDACERDFLQTYGEPLELQKKATASLLSRLCQVTGRDMPGWRSFEELWQAEGLSHLFDFRKRSIARIAERFSAQARKRSLQVGLDLYSYSLAPLVGQDYDLLSRVGDWLKPMTYCHAIGPAGLPLELACLQEAFQTLSPRLGAAGVKRLLMGLLGWDWPGNVEELHQLGLSEEIIAIELKRISARKLSGGARIFAGIEAVRNPDFHIDITAEILERYLAHARQGATGIIASWNLVYIPEENLKVIAAFKQREGRWKPS